MPKITLTPLNHSPRNTTKTRTPRPPSKPKVPPLKPGYLTSKRITKKAGGGKNKRRTRKYRQKGKGNKKSNCFSRKMTLGSPAFPPYKPRKPPNLTIWGALPGTKAYRDQFLKRREENENKK
jgi:hypothetical protein